ncbi:uncharacterized protein LOC115773597 isoform X2 [Archocentrus centrarchus]|uniref:uncharacterized protein LOC115773597 isoform X2 n=1 Tax=Archocentrus centrarchus TaxID=63155 RepID=UPI0011EA10FF|nr:uncharacterized protein LOC115773597 isoform X2 [Archocentrus centrarchus]
MTSERIVIHDPLSHPNGLSDGPTSASDVENMEETVEFRVMMAYATRRRRQLNKKDDSNAQTSPAAKSGEDDADGDVKTPSNTLIHDENKENRKKGAKKKKKKVLKHLSKFFSCTRSQTKDEEVEEQQLPQDPAGDVSDRCFHSTDEPEKKDEEEEKAEEVALRLTELADEIRLTPPEIETDGEDELEKIIGLLLRDTGDRWNEKVLKDVDIKAELFWDYSFFWRLINTFLTRVGLRTSNPNSPGPQASPKTQMAVMCEVTARLSSVETLPANRLLNHGARYMQDNFSSWVQEQGGYEAAFEETEEVD